jgi:hypothetical protein
MQFTHVLQQIMICRELLAWQYEGPLATRRSVAVAPDEDGKEGAGIEAARKLQRLRRNIPVGELKVFGDLYGVAIRVCLGYAHLVDGWLVPISRLLMHMHAMRKALAPRFRGFLRVPFRSHHDLLSELTNTTHELDKDMVVRHSVDETQYRALHVLIATFATILDELIKDTAVHCFHGSFCYCSCLVITPIDMPCGWAQ